MRTTRLALVAGIGVVGAMVFVAVIGATAVSEALMTVVALTALVAGGNWIAGRTTRGDQVQAGPGRAAPAGPMTCPMARWAPDRGDVREAGAAASGDGAEAEVAPGPGSAP